MLRGTHAVLARVTYLTGLPPVGYGANVSVDFELGPPIFLPRRT